MIKVVEFLMSTLHSLLQLIHYNHIILVHHLIGYINWLFSNNWIISCKGYRRKRCADKMALMVLSLPRENQCKSSLQFCLTFWHLVPEPVMEFPMWFSKILIQKNAMWVQPCLKTKLRLTAHLSLLARKNHGWLIQLRSDCTLPYFLPAPLSLTSENGSHWW